MAAGESFFVAGWNVPQHKKDEKKGVGETI